MKRVLVTGGAGFIGSHLIDDLLEDEYDVISIDNFDSFYSRKLKEDNITEHLMKKHYRFFEVDIRDRNKIMNIFEQFKPEIVVHLAAKAGVRPSLEDPGLYVDVNINGTTNVLDASVKYNVKKFIFGSSSSVYGLNSKVPFSEEDSTLQPASPYAATKIAGEALCRSYNNCYKIPTISLRFFTVYGPRQRPDLAINKFVQKIIDGEKIPLFGDGSSSRDYTYVKDIVTGIRSAMSYDMKGYEIFNLGNNHPTRLIDLVSNIENILKKKACIEWLAMQTGDVPITWADLNKSTQQLSYKPKMPLYNGLNCFVSWLEKIKTRRDNIVAIEK
jgi:UDP-glucuronate 4-epimerase